MARMLLLLSSAATLGLLSVLWLAAFLLIWRLMRIRIVALEERVLGFGQQLDHVRRTVSEPRPAPVASNSNEARPATAIALDGLVDAVDSVRESQQEQAAAFARLTELVERLTGEVEQGRADRLEDRIRARFAARGFSDVRILGDLAAAQEGTGQLRVPLESMKGGVTYKGFVVLEAGRIVDEKLTSSHDAFP
jgi:hypothetical protein